ncbi:MAG: PhnD/SsuA/transferrin family substrate-binding protein [Proteobacteria bacterium]|nr:PhnD/SsuA/transferrin family substrate-binding protein [Pseudomonadota bacterium]
MYLNSLHKLSRLLILGLLFVALVACNKPDSEVVDIVAEEPGSSTEQPTIKLAMSAAFVSEAGIDTYKSVTDYLSEKTGLKFEFVTGFSYSTINTMIGNGDMDFGFVCGLPYVLDRDLPTPRVRLVVAPVMKLDIYNNRPKYFSYLIVHKDSAIKTFADTKGVHYVYNDEFSNSGYNMPRAKLIEMKETGGFFGRVSRSGSHEESIRMVATGEADASAVDSLVLDYDLAKNPVYAEQVKVIEMLGPAGIPPLVASSKTKPEYFEAVRKVLVEMSDDPVGRAILDSALVDRFEVVDDENYDDIRRMKRLAEESGFMEIR